MSQYYHSKSGTIDTTNIHFQQNGFLHHIKEYGQWDYTGYKVNTKE